MFEIPRLKVKRADQFLREFAGKSEEFRKSQPYALNLIDDGQSQHLIFEVRALMPDDLTLVLGDAIHNLRSSLDVLVNDAFCMQTGGDQRKQQFFLRRDEQAFDKALSGNLPGAHKDLIEVVRSFQSFRQDAVWLERLCDFDIIDKHRTTLPVVGNPVFQNIKATQLHTGGTMVQRFTPKNVSEIGSQPILSVDKRMNFQFSPNVTESFFFSIDNDLAAAGITVEDAFSMMKGQVLRVIAAVEGLFPASKV